MLWWQSNGVLPIYGLAPSGFLQAKEAGALFIKVKTSGGVKLAKILFDCSFFFIEQFPCMVIST